MKFVKSGLHVFIYMTKNLPVGYSNSYKGHFLRILQANWDQISDIVFWSLENSIKSMFKWFWSVLRLPGQLAFCFYKISLWVLCVSEAEILQTE